MHPKKSQRGGSLFEVLVSVLILGLGILGVAAVQTHALRNSVDSLAFAQAGILGQSMLDSMRSHRAQALAGQYHTGGFVCEANTGGEIGRWLHDVQAVLGESACAEISCQAGAGWCKVTLRWGADFTKELQV